MATQKQRRAAKILSENPRKSVSAAMREAGYSDRSAEKPQELTRSRGFQELMSDALPDELLFRVHRELLKNKNWRAREAGLDKAYKLKGVYAPTKMKIDPDPYADLTIEELDEKIAESQWLVERFKKYPKPSPNVPTR